MPFSSPNAGPSRLRCHQMDCVLEACIRYINAGKEENAERGRTKAAEKAAERSFEVVGRKAIPQSSNHQQYLELKSVTEVWCL